MVDDVQILNMYTALWKKIENETAFLDVLNPNFEILPNFYEKKSTFTGIITRTCCIEPKTEIHHKQNTIHLEWKTMDSNSPPINHQPLYMGRGGGPLKRDVISPNKKGDDDDSNTPIVTRISKHVLALPPLLAWRGFLGVTVALYFLNQSHLLPRPLSGLVSRALFWPTLPITFAKRVGKWTTMVDETVMLGGAPFDVLGLPEKLYDEGVRGVVNMCEEYKGPVRKYNHLGMSQLWLPTTDHFEPEVEDLKAAVEFMSQHEARGERVYVHCRAGHGRSAAAVMAYMIAKDPLVDVQSLNEELCRKRNVRKSLWKQPNIKRFHQDLLKKHASKGTEREEE